MTYKVQADLFENCASEAGSLRSTLEAGNRPDLEILTRGENWGRPPHLRS